jgi:hypothetical protein
LPDTITDRLVGIAEAYVARRATVTPKGRNCGDQSPQSDQDWFISQAVNAHGQDLPEIRNWRWGDVT